MQSFGHFCDIFVYWCFLFEDYCLSEKGKPEILIRLHCSNAINAIKYLIVQLSIHLEISCSASNQSDASIYGNSIIISKIAIVQCEIL